MKQVWVKSPDLLADPLHHGGGAVAHRGHGDAGAEVDELVAVDVDEDAAPGALDVGGEPDPDTGGDHRRLAGVQGLRPGSGSGVRSRRSCGTSWAAAEVMGTP